MVIEKGRVFKDLLALKRWLQAFAVIRKRPYKVLHSYAEHRYTVVCDKESCPWTVCARKQKLRLKHRQLTSTLIAKRLLGILQLEPNMKVRTIIRTVEELYGGYVISSNKAWRAKQRAWKMIYGDWEAGYEQLLVLFNAIKAVNPGMHYEYIPKPNEWKDGRQIFFRTFWCFPQCVEAFRHCRPIFSIDGTFLIGKYRGTLLIAISYDANNNLVPLAFALVERENNDNWGWFLRLVRLHVVGPGREVGIISDRHQGILNAVREQIEGYAPLHHRWCTRHLAENLLRKDGVKDNFELFQDAARQLEDRAHDAGGWRYEFQCSNMAKSFNKLLLGIHAMLVNAIIQFTFYKPVAWFNDRHAYALKLQSVGEKWPPKPKEHLEKAKERTGTHEVTCFDLATGTYQVEHRDGTTSDGEVRDSRMHVYHFLCSHLVATARHRNFDIESMIPHEFSVDTLVHIWSPCFVPFWDSREWPPYDGPKWRPETHTFHLPFREMIVTLEDCQKMLGLTIRGDAVTGPCSVLISWPQQQFAHCPKDANEQTVGNYCRAWILHLFACILFPDATGDTTSWMLEWAYRDYTNELDTLTVSSVSWESYVGEGALPFPLSSMCGSDEGLYRMRCPLILFLCRRVPPA
uniref:MULE transposase domain-containing protein n=1 Tax=Setaria italica TaxID=4555 RepID=K3XRS8_SETIT